MFLHCSGPQGAGLGQISFGSGHFLQKPLETFTLGQMHEGHLLAGGILLLSTKSFISGTFGHFVRLSISVFLTYCVISKSADTGQNSFAAD